MLYLFEYADFWAKPIVLVSERVWSLCLIPDWNDVAIF